MGRTVAIYARVSTEHEAQISALGNQVQYYDNILEQHPDWKLYDRYIDEGITGTSVKKRQSFMRMLDDASNGCFDLILTREVSRFARNTVDTLQETRKLKRMGVEVYFTEDNIWTMNDEDGELRLTIMATLAQNESKKTSLRVKAGQMVSFQNAVPYGNGNVLGYDRVDKEFVINKEQAETVRMIYDMYIDGMGLRKIQFALEKAGRLTATGLTNWSSSCISRILNNSFYCGIITYRKEYVPDYLEQKKIKNFGEVEQIVVEGGHEPIISKEQYEKVQDMLSKKTASIENRGKRGKNVCNDVWTRKLRCSCGGSFNRKIWHKKDGIPQYAFQCYKQIRSGTIETRKRKGLSLEGVCESPMVQQWKLEMMAQMIFQNFWEDKSAVIAIANEMLEKHIRDDQCNNFEREIKETKKKIDRNIAKYKNLVNLRISGEIEKDTFDEMKKELLEEKERLENLLESYQVDEELDDEDYRRRLEVLKYGLEQNFDFSVYKIPETVIDAFVDQIIVHKDCLVWKLNIFDDDIRLKVLGKRADAQVSEVEANSPSFDQRSTGGDCQCRKIDNRKYFYFTTLVITRKDVQEYMKHHPEFTKANRFKDIICKIYI